MYARTVNEEVLTFGVSGKLVMNALVMYDRQTDSLWSQFLGEAIEGPHEGTKLELVPSQLTRWSSWKEEYPDTLALDIGGPAFDQYMDYYVGPSAGILGRSNRDERLVGKDLVIGIVGEDSQRAYAHKHLAKPRVLNDTFEGSDIVVALDLNSGSTGVFDRRVDGRTLTFVQGAEPEEMSDVETGSSWSKLSGLATGGDLQGKRLRPFPSFNAFWFGWSDYFPNTELYDPS